MRIRTKAVTALLGGLALLAMSAVPASANSVPVQITTGTISIFGPFNTTPESVIDLGGTGGGASCSSNGSVTAVGDATGGTITVTISTLGELLDPFGPPTDYLVTLTLSLSGTYDTFGTFTLFGTASAIAKPLTGTCTAEGTEFCSITAIDLVAQGSLSSGTFPTLTAGNVASIAGGNDDIELFVVDSDPTNPVCGGFTAVDFGRVTFNATVCVPTSSPTCVP